VRIAFYAPMKPPEHPVASGDRTVARALIAALQLADHEVTTPSRLRSHDRGDPVRQARLRDLGSRIAERLLRRFERETRPELWFTYHLYHKAPDWLGPAISARLGIPYVVAEASFAPKQAGGRWALGHEATAQALAQAARVFQLNPADDACVRPLLRSPAALVRLPPFLDTRPWRTPQQPESRAEISALLDLTPDAPWILTVAMMREDQKRLSYLRLAESLLTLTDLPWKLVIAGTGPAEAEIREAFAPLRNRVRWVGTLDRKTLTQLYRAADVFAWPAIKEAWGMALLEAQAAGLPVVAGNSGGVASVIADGETGLLAREGDAAAFAETLRTLLRDRAIRRDMGQAAEARAAREHDLAGAAALLDRTLAAVMSERQR
jgi:glycosyltransferase involved in cell wall biosynthesis